MKTPRAQTLCTTLCLALAACSPSSDAKKEEALNATPPAMGEKPRDFFRVLFDTSKGPVTVEIHREWAPFGVDHFYSLVRNGYYDGNRFFRVTHSYVQFGINGDTQVNGLWSTAYLADDPVKLSNLKGTLTYAQLGTNNRTTQLFFNLQDNRDLDKRGFAPIGKVIGGMDVVERIYGGYGDLPPRGEGPDPTQIQLHGNGYLESHFPRLDFIKKASIQ
jgi:cyclophilin family peptidyl-prolyl cis-trans isomerase